MANARRAAGLPQPALNRRWSADRVVEELRRRANAGLATTERALRKAGRIDLIGAIQRYFGSIVRARRVARIPGPPPPVHGERPRRRSAWHKARRLGSPPTSLCSGA
jgi:hypothetical protein